MAHGTYGCVFRPGIPCAGHEHEHERAAYANTVTKVMLASDAESEHNDTQLVQHVARNMPADMRDALILPLHPPCAVNFTDEDLVGAERTCANFDAATRADMRANQSRLRALSQRDGGNEMRDVFSQLTTPAHAVHYGQVTHSILRLMDVVRQMALRGVIHGDLKRDNVVFSMVDGVARMIDWGFAYPLSCDYTQTRWDKRHKGVAQLMYNAMPSTFLYNLKPYFLPAAAEASESTRTRTRTRTLESNNQWAYMHVRQFNDRASGGSGNDRGNPHLDAARQMFEACNNAALLLRLPLLTATLPQLVDTNGNDLPPLDDPTILSTTVYMHHAVALVAANVQQHTRFFIDGVLRLNQDIYGLLTLFVAPFITTLRDAVHAPDTSPPVPFFVAAGAYTAGRFLMDPRYAVEAFDVDAIKAAFLEISNGRVQSGVLTAMPPPETCVANTKAIMARLDPLGARAFNSDTFDAALDAFNGDSITRAMRPVAVAVAVAVP